MFDVKMYYNNIYGLVGERGLREIFKRELINKIDIGDNVIIKEDLLNCDNYSVYDIILRLKDMDICFINTYDLFYDLKYVNDSIEGLDFGDTLDKIDHLFKYISKDKGGDK